MKREREKKKKKEKLLGKKKKITKFRGRRKEADFRRNKVKRKLARYPSCAFRFSKMEVQKGDLPRLRWSISFRKLLRNKNSQFLC